MNTRQIIEEKIQEAKNQARFSKTLGFEATAKSYEEDIRWYEQCLEDCKRVEMTQTVDRYMVEQAWHEQVEAVDRWQWLVEHDFSREIVESAWDEIQAATAYAMELEELYSEQYDQRVYDEHGRWSLKTNTN